MENALFSKVRVPDPLGSVFDMSHFANLSFDMGWIYPILYEECIPGDRWSLKPSHLVRFQSLAAPIMDIFELEISVYFVPHRTIWEKFEVWLINYPTTHGQVWPKFRLDNESTTGYPFTAVGNLMDHMGLPTETNYKIGTGYDNQISLTPFVAYQKIWFDWYRDQKFEYDDNQFTDLMVDGTEYNDTGLITYLQKWLIKQKRCYNPDYFTTANPWAQKGDAVVIPFGQFNDVPTYTTPNVDQHVYNMAGAPDNNAVLGTNSGTNELRDLNDASKIWLNVHGGAQTSLLNTPSPTLDELNRAEKVQMFLQRNAIAGTRMNEYNYAHYKTITKDSRLQKAEFIGAVQSKIVVSEVLQTSGYSEDADNGQVGDMYGRGISFNNNGYFNYHCTEHGTLMALINVQNQGTYTQGIPKKFQNFDQYEIAVPLLANMGEQSVKRNELFITNTASDGQTFGYVQRFLQWKTSFNRVAGDFRASLDYWTYSRKFATQPALNMDFLRWDNDNRIFNFDNDGETEYNQLLGQIYWDNKVYRLLPFHAVPQLGA